jgi:hypothetical protein
MVFVPDQPTAPVAKGLARCCEKSEISEKRSFGCRLSSLISLFSQGLTNRPGAEQGLSSLSSLFSQLLTATRSRPGKGGHRAVTPERTQGAHQATGLLRAASGVNFTSLAFVPMPREANVSSEIPPRRRPLDGPAIADPRTRAARGSARGRARPCRHDRDAVPAREEATPAKAKSRRPAS